MSFKLKGIELDAFRIYQEKQLFNFLTRSGDIANLVVIYAPNGYGKTSFIDAVEWVLTGKINRISKNSILKNTAESEKGVILKNRKSSKEYGSVRLIAENGGFLEKITKIVGKNGRKTDYVDGDIVIQEDIFNKINFSDFSTKSILGQDKIDSFLRSLTSKERYDTLTNFWDDENDSDIYKSILSMCVESEKQKRILDERIKEINNEIESLVIRPQIVMEINNLVNKFNKIKLREFKLPLFISNGKHFVNALIEVYSKIESIILENEANLLNSKFLVENYGTYIKKNKDLNCIRGDIKEISDLLNKFSRREEKNNSLNLVVSESYNLYKKYRSFKELINQFGKYERISKEIKGLEGTNKVIFKDISNLSNYITKEGQKLKTLHDELLNSQKSKQNIEKHFSKLDSNLERFYKLQSKKIHLSNRLLQIKDLTNIRLKYKQEYKKKVLTLESYLKYKIKDMIHIDEEFEQISLMVKNINESYEFKTKKERKLEKLEQEYTRFGKLNKQLNTIYKVGKKLIEDNRAVSCPLCKKEYESFDQLISNVDRDFIEIDKLNELKHDIETVKHVIESETKKINEKMELFRNQIGHEINNILEREIENEARINYYNSLNQRINNKINDISWQEDNLVNFFKLLNIEIEIINSNEIFIENIKTSIKEEINKYIEIIGNTTKKINEHSEIQKQTNKKIQHKELEVVSNKNKIRELKEDKILKDVNQLLEELKIDKDLNIINEGFKEVKSNFLMQLNNRRILQEQISVLDEELESLIKEEVADSLLEKQNIQKGIQDYLNEYKIKINKLNLEDNFQEEGLQQIHVGLKTEHSNAKNGLTVLNELMGFTNYIEKNIASKSKGLKKRELEEQQNILEKGYNELSNARDRVTKIIENKINNAFNLDSINSIYQRIDPHPDFNYIRFEPDLNKEKPEINIYASSKNEKLAPVLYFSAAQVNILSLSIFLAKALIKEQEGLNTIFMDDPIQHLDNLNILSFIDLLRTITVQLDKQVILSTHNENFYKLIKRKMDPKYTKSKFIELESFGKIKN
ncbi:AAA family ATPase [Cytobacillus praedii]|uniref:AAA family ATPase n=1 Tax=Cytobacillus praedii TaxID=1742358 RepID=UPI002E1BEB2D|nr:AAA family ATPase [Cytobacillus praedii]MED3575477.1 hypothetical protein [Cytobacillus praedii]